MDSKVRKDESLEVLGRGIVGRKIEKEEGGEEKRKKLGEGLRVRESARRERGKPKGERRGGNRAREGERWRK